MAQFPALDELVRASEARSPQVAVPLPALVRAAGRPSPRSAKRRTRLTATPDFASPVSENANGAASSDADRGGEIATQDVADTEVVTRSGGESRAGELTVQSSAGEQESPNPVNHIQVVVPHGFPQIIQPFLVEIAVNLRGNQLSFDR